jgi:WD40 repeat protein
VLHAFISYSRRDAAFVDALERELRARGVQIWIDRRDLPVSVAWNEDIEYAISGALLFVVCSSPEWETSENCALEARSAARQCVPAMSVPVEGSPEVAADGVKARFDLERSQGTLRAQVTRRAVDWEKSGRSKGYLSSGRWLRDARKRLQLDGTSLAPLVDEYLNMSVRRDRRRRMTARLGSLVIIVTLLAAKGLNAVQKESNKRLLKSATDAVTLNQITALIDTLPYRALEELGPRAAQGGNGFLYRDRLMRALAVPLPSQSTPVTADDRRQLDQRCAATRDCVSLPQRGLRAVWSWRTGVVTISRPGDALVRRFTVGSGTRALQLSPDGRFVAVGRAYQVRIFSADTGNLVVELSGSDGVVRGVRWSPDGEHVTAVSDRRSSAWDWRPVTMLAEQDDTWFVALSPPDDHGGAVAVSRDGRLVSVAPGRAARDVAKVDIGDVFAASFTSSGRTALIVGERGLAVVAHDGQVIQQGPNTCDATAAATADERTAWLICGDSHLERVALSTLLVAARVPAPERGVLSVVAGSTGLYFTDRITGIGAITPGHRAAFIAARPCGGAFRALALDPTEHYFVAVGDGAGTIGCTLVGTGGGEHWKIGDYVLPRRPGEQARAAAFSPNGKVVAVGYSDGSVATFTMPDETPGWLWLGTPGSIRALRFSADGRTLYVATRDGVVASMPACPSCQSSAAMAAVAARRVKHGRSLGLVS